MIDGGKESGDAPQKKSSAEASSLESLLARLKQDYEQGKKAPYVESADMTAAPESAEPVLDLKKSTPKPQADPEEALSKASDDLENLEISDKPFVEGFSFSGPASFELSVESLVSSEEEAAKAVAKAAVEEAKKADEPNAASQSKTDVNAREPEAMPQDTQTPSSVITPAEAPDRKMRSPEMLGRAAMRRVNEERSAKVVSAAKKNLPLAPQKPAAKQKTAAVETTIERGEGLTTMNVNGCLAFMLDTDRSELIANVAKLSGRSANDVAAAALDWYLDALIAQPQSAIQATPAEASPAR